MVRTKKIKITLRGVRPKWDLPLFEPLNLYLLHSRRKQDVYIFQTHVHNVANGENVNDVCLFCDCFSPQSFIFDMLWQMYRFVPVDLNTYEMQINNQIEFI